MLHVIHDAELVGDMSQVRTHLGTASEVLVPLIVLLKAEFVGCAERVDANIGVTVDGPGSTEFFTTLVDREVDPELLKLDAGSDAVEAATDDRDMETFRGFEFGRRPFGEAGEVVERKNHLAQLKVARFRWLAENHVEHGVNLFIRWGAQRPGRKVGGEQLDASLEET
ncbi:unannotated protein [freshwater metagenome]|uniref:Unannotated protein n=1 Tax=freshwater metagenome TaxID=449393 RepID=A0A6J6Z626_9ZZZZ